MISSEPPSGRRVSKQSLNLLLQEPWGHHARRLVSDDPMAIDKEGFRNAGNAVVNGSPLTGIEKDWPRATVGTHEYSGI